jgi:hypothetical protein
MNGKRKTVRTPGYKLVQLVSGVAIALVVGTFASTHAFPVPSGKENLDSIDKRSKSVRDIEVSETEVNYPSTPLRVDQWVFSERFDKEHLV